MIRIGTLGAARITPLALVRPARALEGVAVTAVAARDPARARAFAARHGIARVHDSYDALVGDPEIDAIYVPLPNGLHGRWTDRGVAAGKHVLCEKPFTANAAEARAVARAVSGSGRVVMEAFHWRYHPLAARMLEVVASGELGEVRHVEASFCIPMPLFGDIRWQLDLAGGSLMDLGCYAVHMVRTLAGSEPAVTRAEARTRTPGVDRYVQADLSFADGRTGRVTCGMLTGRVADARVRVVGSRGRLRALNPVAPQYGHVLAVRTGTGRRLEQVRRASSYTGQLRAFRDAIVDGAPVPTGVDDAVANMTAIDAIYEAAGLAPRSVS